MQEYRCWYEHPKFPGQRCNAFFFKGFLMPGTELSFDCWRCHRKIAIVAASSRTVDSAVSLVVA